MGGAASSSSVATSAAAKPAMSSAAMPATSNVGSGMMAQNAANAAAAKAGQSATQQQKDAWRSALGQSVQDATGQIAKAFAGRQAPVYQPAAMSSPVLAEAANISAPIFPGATKFASSLVENQALNDAMMQQARLSGGGSQGYRF